MNSRCAACKYLRRRCPPDCIFSSYFPSNDPQRFASVHRILWCQQYWKDATEATESMYYEAQCRVADPVYGIVKTISLLNQEIHHAQSQLAKIQAQIAFYNAQVVHGNNKIQNVELPSSNFNNSLANQGDAFHHPTLPLSIRPSWSM
ncbi:LOB domain-containing protein 24 [Vitis vinifera]|uniref:LOB domain-containing protein 24 n=1 Tax=Vitis vinifera TaxID=29760 RepID=A0A438CZ26_VITVI|nr:LOB domain-containing protein 24 [Vitis vinifera]